MTFDVIGLLLEWLPRMYVFMCIERPGANNVATSGELEHLILKHWADYQHILFFPHTRVLRKRDTFIHPYCNGVYTYRWDYSCGLVQQDEEFTISIAIYVNL